MATIGFGFGLLLTLLLSGCSHPDQVMGHRSVHDSAGIEIVLLTLEDSLRSPWVVESDSALTIGVASGLAPFQLSRVRGAVQLSDGRIVVGNEGSLELRYFSSTGSFERAVGHEGEGPGEFRSLSFLGRVAGDSVVVHDTRLRRWSVFTPSGELARSFTAPGVTQLPLAQTAGLLASGSLVLWDYDPTAPEPDGPGVFTLPIVFGLSKAEPQEFQVIGSIASHEEAQVRRDGKLGRAYRPFGRKADFAVARDHIFAMDSQEDGWIRVYDPNGELVSILRIQIPPRTLSPETVNTWKESWISRYSDGRQDTEDWLREAFRGVEPPTQAPVFRSLEADTGGNVCAERFPLVVGDPSTFWCFSPDGFFLGGFRLPAGLQREGIIHYEPHLEIGAGYVLGVWADELGVQFVRRYPLKRDRGV